jgi:uncharacterized membrane protein
MITLEWLYVLAGAMFAGFAILSGLDRGNRKRLGNAAFWGLMAVSLLAGSHIGNFANGLIVLGLAALASFGLIGRGSPPTTSEPEREAWSLRFGNRLFLLALIIPATALLGSLLYLYSPLGRSGLIQPGRETYVLLALGVLAALAVICALVRPPAAAPLQEGRRLIDAMGWAAVLPQLLAALGVVLAAAGVGAIIGDGTRAVLPQGSVLPAIIVYAGGMALFTIATGNAFAAFPVMAAAIGVPILILEWHGDPAVIGAVGMLAGFCGTLMTPMAANYNIVPVQLLDLRDRKAVVKAQIGTALPLLAVNIALLYWFGFR